MLALTMTDGNEMEEVNSFQLSRMDKSRFEYGGLSAVDKTVDSVLRSRNVLLVEEPEIVVNEEDEGGLLEVEGEGTVGWGVDENEGLTVAKNDDDDDEDEVAEVEGV